MTGRRLSFKTSSMDLSRIVTCGVARQMRFLNM